MTHGLSGGWPTGKMQPGEGPGPRVRQPTSAVAFPGQGQVTLGTSLLLAGLSNYVCTMKTTRRWESGIQIHELERITYFIELPNRTYLFIERQPGSLPSEPQELRIQLTDDRKLYPGWSRCMTEVQSCVEPRELND